MRECRSEGPELTKEEVHLLNAMPKAAFEVKPHRLCELEDEHAGPHYVLVQGCGDATNFWLRWTADSREWTHEPTCHFENSDASEFCLLPTGHEGAHSWS